MWLCIVPCPLSYSLSVLCCLLTVLLLRMKSPVFVQNKLIWNDLTKMNHQIISLNCKWFALMYVTSFVIIPPVTEFFGLTLRQSWPNKAGLECPSVHTYVLAYIRPSTKRFFDFSVIWHVGRGRWVMHDGMQYDPIQGQGHEPFKFGNSAIFKSCLLRHLQWELATDHGFLN